MIAAPNLTPRQSRLLLDIATVAMIVSVALALAGLTWRIAGHAGTGAVTVPSGKSGPAVIPNVAPALALAPFGKASVNEASRATALPLELKGVVAARPASLSAAFISVNGAAPLAFRIGENVEGATLEAVLRDRVLLRNGGTLEYLAFPDPTMTPEQRSQAAQAAQAAAPPPPGAMEPVTITPAGSAPPALPAPSSATTATLMQRFDATPADGGYRIGANGPPGLMAGDVLLSVNGTALSDPTAATAAYTAAQASGSAQIVILRDGKRLTLTVPLR